MPYSQEWDQAATLPDELWLKAANDGILMPAAAGSHIPPEWRGNYPIIGNVSPNEWDGFHDFILHDEFGRIGGIGFVQSFRSNLWFA